jgi:hypothetical protein
VAGAANDEAQGCRQMSVPWVSIGACLMSVGLLGGCQNAGAKRLTSLLADNPVTVVPVVNATGRALSLPPDNPLDALRQALGLGDKTPVTVPDVLLNRFVLAVRSPRRDVTPLEKTRGVFSGRSAEIAGVLGEARAAVLKGVVVLATLRRWDDSRWVDTRAVFVSMDVIVARISDGEILDTRAVRNLAVPVGAATTIVQATDDAARWLAERLF